MLPEKKSVQRTTNEIKVRVALVTTLKYISPLNVKTEVTRSVKGHPKVISRSCQGHAPPGGGLSCKRSEWRQITTSGFPSVGVRDERNCKRVMWGYLPLSSLPESDLLWVSRGNLLSSLSEKYKIKHDVFPCRYFWIVYNGGKGRLVESDIGSTWHFTRLRSAYSIGQQLLSAHNVVRLKTGNSIIVNFGVGLCTVWVKAVSVTYHKNMLHP